MASANYLCPTLKSCKKSAPYSGVYKIFFTVGLVDCMRGGHTVRVRSCVPCLKGCKFKSYFIQSSVVSGLYINQLL